MTQFRVLDTRWRFCLNTAERGATRAANAILWTLVGRELAMGEGLEAMPTGKPPCQHILGARAPRVLWGGSGKLSVAVRGLLRPNSPAFELFPGC